MNVVGVVRQCVDWPELERWLGREGDVRDGVWTKLEEDFTKIWVGVLRFWVCVLRVRRRHRRD